jgi:hypothetical protein
LDCLDLRYGNTIYSKTLQRHSAYKPIDPGSIKGEIWARVGVVEKVSPIRIRRFVGYRGTVPNLAFDGIDQ